MKLKKIAFSTFFLTCILILLVAPLVHSFENDHNSEICDFNDIEHFCNHEVENNQFYIHFNLGFTSSFDYQIFNKSCINSIDVLHENFLTHHKNLSFSLRGPPAKKFI